MSISHLYLFLAEMSIRALPHFKIGFWVFLPIHSMSPLAILDIYLFSDVYHLLIYITSPTQQVAFFFC